MLTHHHKNTANFLPSKFLSFIKANVNYYFILSIIAILIIKTFTHPSLTIHPEIVQDGGINFLRVGLTEPIWKAIIYPDAGYLPFFQRFLSLLLLKTTPLKYINYSFQWTSLFLSATFISLINLRIWRSVIRSDIIRFSLGIYISIFAGYSSYLFENFPLFSCIFLLTIILIDFENLSFKKYLLLLAVVFLVVPSKPLIIGFSFVYSALAFYYLKRGKTRTAIFYTISLIPFLGQFVYLFYTRFIHKKYWQEHENTSFTENLELIAKSLHSHINFVPFVPNIEINSSYSSEIIWSNYFLILIFTLLTLLLAFIFWKYEPSRFNVKFNFTLIALFLITVAFMVSSGLGLFSYDSPTNLSSSGVSRHSLVPFILISIFWISSFDLLINFLLKAKIVLSERYLLKSFEYLTCVMVFALSAIHVSTSVDPFYSHQESYSQWSYYHKLVSKEGFAIPTNTINPRQYWLTSYQYRYLNSEPAGDTYGKKFIGLNSVGDKSYEFEFSLDQFAAEELKAFVVKLTDDQLTEPLEAEVLIPDQNKYEYALQVNPPGYRYRYFMLEEAIASQGSLRIIFTSSGKPASVNSEIFLIGKTGN